MIPMLSGFGLCIVLFGLALYSLYSKKTNQWFKGTLKESNAEV